MLRLLGALRGNGLLTWRGDAFPVRYELDLFSGGDTRFSRGRLEGAGFTPSTKGPDGAAPEAARLRLDENCELDIDLVAFVATEAEFEACGAAISRYLQSHQSDGVRRLSPELSAFSA